MIIISLLSHASQSTSMVSGSCYYNTEPSVYGLVIQYSTEPRSLFVRDPDVEHKIIPQLNMASLAYLDQGYLVWKKPLV